MILNLTLILTFQNLTNSFLVHSQPPPHLSWKSAPETFKYI